MKLLMVKIGATPTGRLIEQHDIMFFAVDDFTQISEMVNQAWKDVKNKWHIDAWREINRVGDFRIELVAKNSLTNAPIQNSNQLFFVNLGGYLPNVFEEFHYKDLIVAQTLSQATAQLRKSEFYQTYDLTETDPLTGANGVSHIDNKVNLAVDDVHSVHDLITSAYIKITPLTEAEKTAMPHDSLHIGYLSRKHIKNFLGTIAEIEK